MPRRAWDRKIWVQVTVDRCVVVGSSASRLDGGANATACRGLPASLSFGLGQGLSYRAEQAPIIIGDRRPGIDPGSTVIWWRNTMISRSFERPDRTAKRAIGGRKRYKIRTMEIL